MAADTMPEIPSPQGLDRPRVQGREFGSISRKLLSHMGLLMIRSITAVIRHGQSRVCLAKAP